MNTEIIQRLHEFSNLDYYLFEEYKTGTPEKMFRDSHYVYVPDKDDIYIENLIIVNNFLKDFDNYDVSQVWIIHKYFNSGDYVGSAVERSNTIAFLDEYKDRSGIKPVYGGYGFTSVAISLSWLLDPIHQETTEEILEIFKDFSKYPLISEDAFSQVEQELCDSSWECCFEDDFTSALIKASLIAEDDELSDIRSFFEEMAARADINWINESGTSMFIDVDEVVKQITKEDILPYIQNGS